jgi:hypothetical protein
MTRAHSASVKYHQEVSVYACCRWAHQDARSDGLHRVGGVVCRAQPLVARNQWAILHQWYRQSTCCLQRRQYMCAIYVGCS